MRNVGNSHRPRASLPEWARRRLGAAAAPRAIDVLLRGEDPATTGLPAHWNESLRSFYELIDEPGASRRCIGTACAFAGASPAEAALQPVCCLGRCYEAPASDATFAARIPRLSLARETVILRHLLGDDGAGQWADYDLPGGAAILSAVAASGLRGRGGAAYPTAAKWKAARDTPATQRYVVANGDEGDPGAYIDRLLLEEAPHSILAGMLACARAIGARHGIVYVRAEYPRAALCMSNAIAEANARGVLEDFDVRVVRGAGAYVAGEETALLRSIEGLRAEPHPKPPYPATRGLFGLPTVVQNIETLSIVPWVARRGRRGDTKAFCLSGAVRRPGVVELELGSTLRRVLEDGGGGPAQGKRWKMALIGGPLGRIVAAGEFDVELSFDRLPGMGHAGIVVFDDSVRVRAVAEHLFEFARSESCGNCAPCRIGTSHLASRRTITDLDQLLLTLEEGSLCGFGQGVPRPIRDLVRAFGDEVLA